MIRTFYFIIILALSVAVQAQKKYTDTDKANALRNIYKDQQVVASNCISEIRFELQNNQPVAYEQYTTDLIALQSNIKYYKNVYYNDNIDLTKGQVKYSSGRGNLRYNKVFGNYEVDDIFYSDAKIGHYSFDMLYEGTEATFISEKKYKDPRYLTKVFFKDTEPVHKRDITFIIPQAFDVELVEMNFDGYDIVKEVNERDGSKLIHYTCNKLKELENETNSPGLLHSTPHIVVLTKSYKANAIQNKILSTTDDLYAWYHSLTQMVQVNHEAYQSTVEKLIKDAGSDEEKIRNIYYWIQENIKYIAFEDGIAGFRPEAPQNVFNNRYGDCKGMAILTKSMLEVAGIDARLTWIGTDKIPYNYDIPSLAADNHMICTAFVKDDMYVLDATEKYIALGKVAERIQGQEMLIEDGNSYIRKTVPDCSTSENLIARTETINIKDNLLIGKGQVEFNGETKKSILYLSNNSKVEDKAQLFDFLSVSASGNEDLVNVNNTPETDRDKPLVIEYDYSIGNKIYQFDNELFIELDWEKPMSQTKIKKERLSSYDLGRKMLNKTIKHLTIPKGYKISHLPQKVSYKNDNIDVEVHYQHKGNTIIYTNSITIAKGEISANEFETWNTIIESLNTFYNDQIILKKI
ncbi:transglutaminase domain-containing protein [Carboxylicivirga mesophila]|uniref:Transglutaminase domain-containing protein n=1 Tax=Carboxylicivirga mesophila TaxID=1166478 RepID=A0ABS5KET9_9BACT|nr:transglutaminase domain-containing protein [Carboxylicivirga mesophila]MBS2213569.1 transglutaminase domain-containing protein [Carboxylicivirga mesophila]